MNNNYSNITVQKKDSTNPNDNVSSKAVDITFYNENNILFGEASVSAIDTPTAFLYNVEVFPEFRGQGYGNIIMQYILDNYQVTELTVDPSNTVAISLYNKFGFEKEMTFEENNKQMLDMKRHI